MYKCVTIIARQQVVRTQAFPCMNIQNNKYLSNCQIVFVSFYTSMMKHKDERIYILGLLVTYTYLSDRNAYVTCSLLSGASHPAFACALDVVQKKMFVVSFVIRIINAELSVPSITYVDLMNNGTKSVCIGCTYVYKKRRTDMTFSQKFSEQINNEKLGLTYRATKELTYHL